MGNIEVFFGVTSHSQLKRLPRDISIMVSARWLLKWPRKSVAFEYLKEYKRVFLDSGAFGSAFYDGGFQYTLDAYIELVKIVKPDYWVSMDFPCEASIMPGMNTTERIQRSIDNNIILNRHGISGFVPVVQGWQVEDYCYCCYLMDHFKLVRPVMGIGSVCRRGSQKAVLNVIRAVHNCFHDYGHLDVKYHAFGIKIRTLQCQHGEVQNYLHSFDTAAWQMDGKDERGGWRNCSGPGEALKRLHSYNTKINRLITGPYQLSL